MTDFLDSRSEIANWVVPPLANTIFLTSKYNTKVLADLIRGQFPGMFFVLTEVSSMSTDGWLQNYVWDHVANPKSSGRWPQNN